MPGIQEIYEERWEPGPDGKLVKKVYTLKRELTDKQAEELAKQSFKNVEQVGMFDWLMQSPAKPRKRSAPSSPFDLMFQAIDKMFRR